MHLSYGKYAKDRNIKEVGNGKNCMLKGIKNMKQKEARVLSLNFRSCFSSGSCRITWEAKANNSLN